MEKNKLFSIGTITKKDWIILNDRVNEPTALVLISEHPYSGYYGTKNTFTWYFLYIFNAYVKSVFDHS